MTDEAWNAPFVRSLGVLMVGNAIDDVDERGRLVSGDTLLILLNAHFESRAVRAARRRATGTNGCASSTPSRRSPPEARFDGGTKYPLQGRTVVLFTLEKHRRHRRASDYEAEDIRERLALQVTADGRRRVADSSARDRTAPGRPLQARRIGDACARAPASSSSVSGRRLTAAAFRSNAPSVSR